MVEKIGKTFWINIVIFIIAILIFLFNQFLKIGIDYVWYGVMFVFGSYAGCDGIATLITSRQMPKGERYTTSYNKMMALVLFTLTLFIIALILSLVYSKMGIQIEMNLTTGFFATCSISAIFVSTKKLNNGMKNLSTNPEETISSGKKEE